MSYRPGTGANRRKLMRLPASMTVGITLTGMLRRQRRINAKAVDYNRYGMALLSPVNVRARTRVLMDINAGHMVLRRVSGMVVSSTRQGKEYRLGLRFYRKITDFADPGPGHPFHFLLGLEQVLDRPAQPAPAS